jgi:hypothetical protein
VTDEDDRVLRLVPETDDLAYDELKPLLLLLLDLLSGREDTLLLEADTAGNDGLFKALLVDGGEDEVGREGEVGGTSVSEGGEEDTVDFLGGVVGGGEDGLWYSFASARTGEIA